VNDRPTQKAWEDIPFGAMEVPPGYAPPGRRSASNEAEPQAGPAEPRPTPTQPVPRTAPSPAAPSPAARGERRPTEARVADVRRGPPPDRGGPPRERESQIGASPAGAPASGPQDGPQDGPGPDGEPRDWRKPENRRGRGRRGGRRRRHGDEAYPAEGQATPAVTNDAPGQQGFAFEGEPASERDHDDRDDGDVALGAPQGGQPRAHPGQFHPGQAGQQHLGQAGQQAGGRRRRRRGRRGRTQGPYSAGPAGQGGSSAADSGEGGVATAPPPGGPAPGNVQGNPQGHFKHGKRPHGQGHAERAAPQVLTGMLVQEKGGWGILRREEAQFLPSKDDIWVPQQLIARFKLREGSLITGPCGRGQQHKHQLNAVDLVDGKDPREVMALAPFKKLVSIDPDFHYAVGDIHGDASMRVVDLIAPVGRGSRGLIVAPPRSGKTILMRKFANAITEGYPDVHLMVLLVDERPEEATEWKRTTKGQVFVSTNDEDTKNHVELAEAVFRRCQRLVELGQDVVLLLDSITRLARAFNNHMGTSGKTMSGGLDSRAMERPRAFFGMARNTETAGSLTILGTTLVETGSRLDQMVFEEFKGTGNLEIVLSRKLADRRIFPAIDIERSGTRKEEKLLSATRLKRTHVLRRVLLKMNFIEAMELLSTKLEEVEKTDDFLKRFDVDPEA
jgi:transcription termination factor Rho